jgi:hypothetical protein
MVMKGWRVLCSCPLALPMSPVSLPGDVLTCRPFRRPNTSLLSSRLIVSWRLAVSRPSHSPSALMGPPVHGPSKRLQGRVCLRAWRASEGGREWGRATAWLRSAWLRKRGGSGRATVCGEQTGRRSSPPPHVMRLVQSRCCPGVTGTGRCKDGEDATAVGSPVCEWVVPWLCCAAPPPAHDRCQCTTDQPHPVCQ